jgi:cell shape-determining protein MreC
MLVKGMVGIVTIIPNMIVAIPESINALSSLMRPIEEKIIQPMEEEPANTELDGQVLDFLAFKENL